MYETLQESFQSLLKSVGTKTYRYLYQNLHFPSKLTGIVGPRGVGKTTLMLQYIKAHFSDTSEVLYFSADHIFLVQTTLFEFVYQTYKTYGVKWFFIDEVHKYSNWNQELKNIYDSFPDIRIVFSGSSSIDLIRGSYDLSRRADLLHLHGMSFREYLNFVTNSNYPPLTFDEIVSDTRNVDKKFLGMDKVIGHFKDYLRHGYYPFYFDSSISYYERIERVIKQSIYEDIASFYNLKTPNLIYLEKILAYLATIKPGEVNTHNIAKNLRIDDKTVATYLQILQESGLIQLIYADVIGNPVLRKPQKIFLHNTTQLSALAYLIDKPAELGTLRELFFLHSLSGAGLKIKYSKQGDYQVKDIVFEMGGKNKTEKQIQSSTQKAFLALDDITISVGKRIPLYYFGFLY
jgi:predicted AAA+ superfamily ATPase